MFLYYYNLFYHKTLYSMLAICNDKNFIAKIFTFKDCLNEASVVYTAVKIAGQSSYNEDQKWVSANAGKNTKNPIHYCVCSNNDKKLLLSKNFLIKDDRVSNIK
ncbi:hypothetical protein H8356DRAFT_421926 [Neocallimastix lanati (nom. inval.)]|nr:hypothetical protein H8356DRAFT_421926 [Neocallimastix sp. JGI-2020a]